MSTNKQASPAPNYSRYEAMKRDWHAKNPGATQAQIDAAMRVIAKKCGV